MGRTVSVFIVVAFFSFGGEVAKGQTGDAAGVGSVLGNPDGQFYTETVTDEDGFTETELFPEGSVPSDATGGTKIAAGRRTVFAGPISAIGPFAGTFQEGFESFPFGQFVVQLDVFGGEAVVRTTDGSANVHVTGCWSFFGQVCAHSGQKFMGSANPPVEWVFDTPASMFGGYFATNSGTDDGIANFYDENDNLIAGGLVVSAPQATNAWVWNGWETTGPGIKRVEIIGNAQWGGGFIMHDDMELTAGDPPVPGACCLVSGDCLDNMTAGACAAAGGDYQGDGTLCEDVFCPEPVPGACCFGPGDCQDDMTAGECAAAGGSFQGDETTCENIVCPEAVPTVSEWGLIIMTLLLLTAGTIVFGRRRRPAVA